MVVVSDELLQVSSQKLIVSSGSDQLHVEIGDKAKSVQAQHAILNTVVSDNMI